MRLAAVLCCSFVFAGCFGSSENTAEQATTSGAGRLESVHVKVDCGAGWYALDADWQRHGVVVGRFGVNADGLGYSERRRSGDNLAKAPFAIEGHKPVTVTVLPEDRGTVKLAYDIDRPGALRGQGADQVVLEPCHHRPRTSFVGAILAEEPRSVSLLVELAPGRTTIIDLPLLR